MYAYLCFSQNPTLRYSLCICEKEKNYIERRKVKVMEAMKQQLGAKAPQNVDEVTQ